MKSKLFWKVHHSGKGRLRGRKHDCKRENVLAREKIGLQVPAAAWLVQGAELWSGQPLGMRSLRATPLCPCLAIHCVLLHCIALYDDAAHCTVLAAISLAAGELSKSFISTATEEKPSQLIVANNLHNMHSPL